MGQERKKPEPSFVQSHWASLPDVHRFSHQAMATTFEIIAQNADKLYAEQAANAAFDELDRIESELSRYVENSDVTRINNAPAGRPVPLGLDTFECLQISGEIHAQTGGAFDVTVGFLVDCWLDDEKKPRVPSAQELEFARKHTGMRLLFLDRASHSVTLAESPVRVDLGGVGKGYGVDKMAELLREWSIDRALIHGGFSSVLALEAPKHTPGWPVTLSDPNDRTRTLARLELRGAAVSGSGVEKGTHIIDPRSARPVEGTLAAWALARDATRADALSTAFMVMAPAEVKAYCAEHPDVRALLIVQGDQTAESAERIVTAGPWKETELAY
jgi:thiamine biosynthesis lipoprotein